MLVYVQLETCHTNHDAVAWYAYVNHAYRPAPHFVLGLVKADERYDEADSRFDKAPPLGFRMADINDVVEVPNLLSEHAGLWRFYVGEAA